MQTSSFITKTYTSSTSNTSIPRDEIHHGGPPKDGIPAIDEPKFVKSNAAGFLAPEDRVMGMSHNGVTKAYPVKILNYHEVVNDDLDQ